MLRAPDKRWRCIQGAAGNYNSTKIYYAEINMYLRIAETENQISIFIA